MPNRWCSFTSNWTIMWCARVRPEANPPPHSQVVPRAADKSRTRDFLSLAHALTAVAVFFPQLPYLVAWGQYCRLSLLSMPCASPLKNGLHRNSLISRAEDNQLETLWSSRACPPITKPSYRHQRRYRRRSRTNCHRRPGTKRRSPLLPADQGDPTGSYRACNRPIPGP
jgi:hypothetical protein